MTTCAFYIFIAMVRYRYISRHPVLLNYIPILQSRQQILVTIIRSKDALDQILKKVVHFHVFILLEMCDEKRQQLRE